MGGVCAVVWEPVCGSSVVLNETRYLTLGFGAHGMADAVEATVIVGTAEPAWHIAGDPSIHRSIIASFPFIFFPSFVPSADPRCSTHGSTHMAALSCITWERGKGTSRACAHT